jgi:hypothetical protein
MLGTLNKKTYFSFTANLYQHKIRFVRYAHCWIEAQTRQLDLFHIIAKAVAKSILWHEPHPRCKIIVKTNMLPVLMTAALVVTKFSQIPLHCGDSKRLIDPELSLSRAF